VDDGDGKHVLPITVKLPLVTITPTVPSTTVARQAQSQSRTQTGTESQGTHFMPAKERKALRKLAVLESQAVLKGKSKEKEKENVKGYMRNDIRVGDTLRVRGRIDEYRRGGEWVRVVVVEPGSGGSVGMSCSSSGFLHRRLLSTLPSDPLFLVTGLGYFDSCDTWLMNRGSRSRAAVPPPLDRLRTTFDALLPTVHVTIYDRTQSHADHSSRP